MLDADFIRLASEENSWSLNAKPAGYRPPGYTVEPTYLPREDYVVTDATRIVDAYDPSGGWALVYHDPARDGDYHALLAFLRDLYGITSVVVEDGTERVMLRV